MQLYNIIIVNYEKRPQYLQTEFNIYYHILENIKGFHKIFHTLLDAFISKIMLLDPV